MKVERIGGSIDPALNTSWEKSKQLEWKAACAELEWKYRLHSLKIKIDAESNFELNLFNIQISSTKGINLSSGPYSFEHAWTFLSAVDCLGYLV